MAIDELPDAPDPATDTPQAFSQKAAAMVLAQRALPGQINEAMAEFSALAAGGAYAFPYMFDSATADADPGPGKLRLSSATQNAASALRIDVLTQGGVSIAGLFDALLAVTSSLKGAVRIVKAADPAKWMLFDVSSVGTGAGYRNINLVYRAGSSASPFANGDGLMVYIDRNGDSGTVPGATELLATMNVSAVSAISFPNVFDSTHDWYFVHIDLSLGANATSGISVQLAQGGAFPARFYYQQSSSGATPAASSTFSISPTSTTNLTSIAGVLQIGSTNSARPTPILWDGAALVASIWYAMMIRGASPGGSPLSGFSIQGAQAASFTGTVRVYGVRNL